jgi:hypothetical protein
VAGVPASRVLGDFWADGGGLAVGELLVQDRDAGGLSDRGGSLDQGRLITCRF